MIRYLLIYSIWTLMSICFSCKVDLKESVFVERFPSNFNALEEESFDLIYKEAELTRLKIANSEFYLVNLDENGNGINVDRNIDLVTIVPKLVDTIKIKHFDTLRQENYFRIDGVTFSLSLENSEILLQKKPIEESELIRGNIVFSNLTKLEYTNFDDVLVEHNFSDTQATYLYFWSPRCSPCLSQLNVLNNYANRFQNDLNIIALSSENEKEQSVALLDREEYLLNAGVASEEVLNYVGLEAFSTGYLFDSEGNLIGKNMEMGDMLRKVNVLE